MVTESHVVATVITQAEPEQGYQLRGRLTYI